MTPSRRTYDHLIIGPKRVISKIVSKSGVAIGSTHRLVETLDKYINLNTHEILSIHNRTQLRKTND